MKLLFGNRYRGIKAASNVLRSCGDVDDGQGGGRWMKQYLM